MTAAPLDLAKRLRAWAIKISSREGVVQVDRLDSDLTEAATALEDHARMLAQSDAAISRHVFGFANACTDQEAAKWLMQARDRCNPAAHTAKGKEEDNAKT